MEFSETDLSSIAGKSVFISLRDEDIPHVKGIEKLLKSLGTTIYWMGDFRKGEWRKQIYDHLENSDCLLIYISYQKEKSKYARILSEIFRKIRTKIFLREDEDPDDWIKHEYEVFTRKKGTGDVIVYLEAGAQNPGFLSEQQFHRFSNALSDIRDKWEELKDRKISKGEARKAVLAMLREKGIDLGQADEFFDVFGVHSLTSLWRFFMFRLRAALMWVPVAATVAAIALFGFIAGDLTAAPPKVMEPKVTQAALTFGQNGRLACQKQGMACVSVSQTHTDFGTLRDNARYGYVTPTCESTIRRSHSCKTTWDNDYEITGVYYLKSKHSNIPTTLSKSSMCLAQPEYQFANCVPALGD
ncbi:MAG: hypothetical protein AAF367_01005 [Pseudomonadota bacterium]